MNASNIQDRFAHARAAGQRHKEAAASIGISEGAAIAAHTGTHDRPLKATPLRGDWLEILKALEACGRHCKTAIVMVLADLSAEAAQSLLAKNNGYIRKALSNT